MSHLTWVQGAELGSSERAVWALKCWAIPSTPERWICLLLPGPPTSTLVLHFVVPSVSSTYLYPSFIFYELVVAKHMRVVLGVKCPDGLHLFLTRCRVSLVLFSFFAIWDSSCSYLPILSLTYAVTLRVSMIISVMGMYFLGLPAPK